MPPRNPNKSRRVEVFRNQYSDESASSFLRFPAQPFPHSILLVFKTYEYKKPDQNYGLLNANRLSGGGATRTIGHSLRSVNSVELPFPKQLSDNTSLRINGYERDPLVENMVSMAEDYINNNNSTVADLPGIFASMGAGAAQQLKTLFTGGGGDGNVSSLINQALNTNLSDVAQAAKYVLQKTLPASVANQIDNVTGQTINPRETLAFEGVNLRSHQFSWDLYPSNPGDSEQIRKIINLIKRNSLPEVSSIAGIDQAFLKYPSVVDAYLIGIDREHYMKFKTSMVTNFSVDYGAGGNLAIMKGGKPAGVTLSLSFQELEIETKRDYSTSSPDATPEASIDPKLTDNVS